MQQLPDLESTDSKEKTSCLKRLKNNGGKKLCVQFQSDPDKFNIVVYHCRNSLHPKDNVVDLKVSE